jgi:hypothetical protein
MLYILVPKCKTTFISEGLKLLLTVLAGLTPTTTPVMGATPIRARGLAVGWLEKAPTPGALYFNATIF